MVMNKYMELYFRRNQNSRDILSKLSGSLGNKTYSDFDISNQFNHVFWVGDLNYRVDEEVGVSKSHSQHTKTVIVVLHDRGDAEVTRRWALTSASSFPTIMTCVICVAVGTMVYWIFFSSDLCTTGYGDAAELDMVTLPS